MRKATRIGLGKNNAQAHIGTVKPMRKANHMSFRNNNAQEYVSTVKPCAQQTA